jgi:hypothetical protein
MAKVRYYAVDVEITVKRTLFIQARKPGGAAQKLLTREGWAEATRYEEDDAVVFGRDDATIVGIKEAGI